MPPTVQKKSKGERFRVYIATSFEHPVFCEIESLAKHHGLANAQMVRELFLRGLAAYHRDGEVREPVDYAENNPTVGGRADEQPSANILAAA
jgi:hypothetical protein